nr:DUF421 domain-containing protein [Paenibacillus castaneae]
MLDYINIFCRTILAFIILIIISRILGKQTVSNMTFHDFATGITMGAIAGNLAFNTKFPVLYFIFSLAVFTAISYTSSWVALKYPKTRHFISGAPTVVIEKGKILDGNMRKIHYTLDSLNQSLRENDIFNINEVEYATLETNGQLSVLKKDQYLNLTKQDIHMAYGVSNFPIELIMDGKLMNKNLSQNKIPEDWVRQQINERGKQLSDIFYAVKTTNGSLVFDYYDDKLNHPVDKE